MADVKWIKITTDIFDDEKMYAIETMQDGYLIELIWFKLLCLAGKCNNHGFLMINNKIAYTDEMLSKIFRIEVGSIQRALNLFQELEMIEVVENAYMIANWDRHQNVKGLDEMKKSHAEAQARYRQRQKLKALEQKSDVTSDVTSDSQNDIIPSYSYSISNSNYINTKNILDIYKDKYEYINSNKELLDSILEWMEYKDSIKPKSKHHYGTEMGLCKLLTQIQNKATEKGIDYVIANIDNSIAHTWVGITWLDDAPIVKNKHVEIPKTNVEESIDYGWED